MPEITGGQAVHDALVKLGVKHVFGIPSMNRQLSMPQTAMRVHRGNWASRSAAQVLVPQIR